MDEKITVDIVVDRYIPIDKSWVIRMGILYLLYGEQYEVDSFVEQISSYEPLGDDLSALVGIIADWNNTNIINVGESGTLYRFFRYINWKLGLKKIFVTSGTLKNRDICDNPNIIDFDQEKLLQLDNNTSQWASAAVLCGDGYRIDNPPFKLDLTYKAWDMWHDSRGNDLLVKDDTILKQAVAYIDMLDGKKPNFTPQQAEDYPFAYTFGYMSASEGARRWPSLRGHETNRITDMTMQKDLAERGELVTSPDHRVVQALAMWGP